MSEYYAVQRSDEYLEHYGIKGMKWGVRKAIEKGNDRKLSRQYAKASKKLAKLQNKANVDYQNKRIKNASHMQKMAAAFGAANLGVSAGLTASSISRAIKQANRTGYGAANIYHPVGAGIAAVDIAARQIGKRKAKKLVTIEGHKQAVKKANEFKNEMSKAFKDTKYGKNVTGMAKDIAAMKRRHIENNVKKIDRTYANSQRKRVEAYANSNSNNRHGRKRR